MNAWEMSTAERSPTAPYIAAEPVEPGPPSVSPADFPADGRPWCEGLAPTLARVGGVGRAGASGSSIGAGAALLSGEGDALASGVSAVSGAGSSNVSPASAGGGSTVGAASDPPAGTSTKKAATAPWESSESPNVPINAQRTTDSVPQTGKSSLRSCVPHV